MESIGQKFREARKEQGLFIEQVAKDTNISKRYIEAIEEEKFDDIPGEVYLFGFFRAYAGYLGIDADEIIRIYKNIKIQEQPIPMDELLDKKPAPPSRMLIAAAALLLLVAVSGTAYFFLTRTDSPAVSAVHEKDMAFPAGETHEMNRAFIERRFNEGDAVDIKHRNETYRIIIKQALDNIVVLLPDGIQHEINEGAQKLFDLDSDETNDIKIMVRSIDSESRSAVLRFDKTTEAPGAAVAQTDLDRADEALETEEPGPSEAVSAAVPAAQPAVPERRKPETDILNSGTKETFTVSMNFRGFCLIRYKADNLPGEERYFHRGESFVINVNNEAVFWVSNAGAVSATVNNRDYSFGGAGEVSVRQLKWVEDSSGRGYTIRAFPLY